LCGDARGYGLRADFWVAQPASRGHALPSAGNWEQVCSRRASKVPIMNSNIGCLLSSPFHLHIFAPFLPLLSPSLSLQAMDRCHRLGQDKPVLVLRLATAHSVEGKLLKRANSKLALERLVIKKGAFLPGSTEVS